ncbi:MAG: PAS domain-containing protein, partial [Hylemonella sp.]|nr:PAS domain-containing protein [Hylemonella sp.]
MVTGSLLNDLQVAATHQLLEALVESEGRMRRRLELLSEVVFELDTKGQIVYLNPAWTTLTGLN